SLKAALLRLSKTIAADRAPSRTAENSPAFQHWVRRSSCLSPGKAGHETADAARRGRTTAFGAQPLGSRNGLINLTFASRQTPKPFGYSCSLKALLLRPAKICAMTNLRVNPFVAISDPV